MFTSSYKAVLEFCRADAGRRGRSSRGVFSASTVPDALRWHPKAHQLVVVTGAAPWDREWTARLREELSQFQGRATLEFLSGLPTAELLKGWASERNRNCLHAGLLSGRCRPGFRSSRLGGHDGGAATAPVYAPAETYIGTGVVRGRAPSFRGMGKLAGQFADKLLRGAEPGSCLARPHPTELHVDWRQVRRWAIRERHPDGCRRPFREPTLWGQRRTLVLATIAVVLFQAALITALLLERPRRRRTAAALQESEQRIVVASSAAGLSAWIWDLGNQKVWATVPRHPDGEPAVVTTDFASAMSWLPTGSREGGARGQSSPRHGQRIRDGIQRGSTRWRGPMENLSRPRRLRGYEALTRHHP